MIIVAILTVRRAELDAFRRFETAAQAIMRDHGGRIERAIAADSESGEQMHEIHIVHFETAQGFDAYRADARLVALQELRATAVIETRLFIGEDVPLSTPVD